MKKILIAGAGGAPTEGVVNSLLLSRKKETILGMGSEPTDLVLSNAHKKFYVPYANTPEYKSALLKILKEERPDLVHFQNDLEYSTLLYLGRRFRHRNKNIYTRSGTTKIYIGNYQPELYIGNYEEFRNFKFVME